MKHSDYCTHIKNEEDRDILTRPNFDVNMRLFYSNPQYRHIVSSCCDLIRLCTLTEKEGYKAPHGWSGANAGIPFNIIGVKYEDACRILINPNIYSTDGKRIKVKTNCGSVILKEPTEMVRWEYIWVRYFNEFGESFDWGKIGPNPGFTIQHEIQHTQGILII